MASKPPAEPVARLEAEVRSLETALNTLYSQAGKHLLESAERTARQANALTEQLVDAKQRLAATRGDARCDACQALNPPMNRYCGCCGARLTDNAT